MLALPAGRVNGRVHTLGNGCILVSPPSARSVTFVRSQQATGDKHDVRSTAKGSLCHLVVYPVGLLLYSSIYVSVASYPAKVERALGIAPEAFSDAVVIA